MRTTMHDDAMQAQAGSAAAPSAMRLGVLVGTRRWLVDLAEAGEIVPVPAIAPVPLTRPWFRGLANLRGALYTVVDLAAFAGEAPAAFDKDARLLALGERLQFNAALLVSRMLGLRSTAAMRRRPDAAADDAALTDPGAGAVGAAVPGATDTAAQPAWQGETWLDEAGAAWHELVLHRLVRDERFLEIGR